MDRETLINELKITRRRQYLATLTPLERSLLRAKMVVARLADEEGGCEGLQTAKQKG